MKKYFRKFYDPEDLSEKDLPFYEYLRFFKGWDLIVFAGDLLTIIGTFGMVLELQVKQKTLHYILIIYNVRTQDHKIVLCLTHFEQLKAYYICS